VDYQKNDGSPYKVFTPFYRKGCLGAKPPQVPLDSPTNMEWRHDNLKSIKLNQLDLLPEKKWVKQLKTHWKIGEQGALLRLNKFIDEGLGKYKTKRNFPDKPHVSRLSPHLHFGEISPNQLWYALYGLANNKNVDHFLSELGWREFSYSQLYQNPDLPRKNLQPKFDLFPWVDNEAMLMAWKKGETGVPMQECVSYGKPDTCIIV
jgi:deoxyribodipyrimidine photo-lyase